MAALFKTFDLQNKIHFLLFICIPKILMDLNSIKLIWNVKQLVFLCFSFKNSLKYDSHQSNTYRQTPHRTVPIQTWSVQTRTDKTPYRQHGEFILFRRVLWEVRCSFTIIIIVQTRQNTLARNAGRTLSVRPLTSVNHTLLTTCPDGRIQNSGK